MSIPTSVHCGMTGIAGGMPTPSMCIIGRRVPFSGPSAAALQGKIALILRGTCYFVEKTAHAEAAGRRARS